MARGRRARGVLSPSPPQRIKRNQLIYDLSKAKQLVAEAKAEGWDGTIKVAFTNSPSGQSSGIAVEAMLKAAGMNVVLDTTKDSTAQQAMVTTSKDDGTRVFTLSMTFEGADDEIKFMYVTYTKRK